MPQKSGIGVKPLFQELAALLQEDDTNTALCLEQLKEKLKGTSVIKELDQLEQLIGQYDFEGALQQSLHEIAHSLEIHLG